MALIPGAVKPEEDPAKILTKPGGVPGTTRTPPINDGSDTQVPPPRMPGTGPVGDTPGAPAPAPGLPPVPGVPPAQPPAPEAPIPSYTPVQRTVTADERVEDRVANLVSGDGPLIQAARARAMMDANRFGTLNSSMTLGAVQSAMIDAALPIARDDAALYSGVARDNWGASNDALKQRYDAELQQIRDQRLQAYQQGNTRLEAELRERENALQREFQARESEAQRRAQREEAEADRRFRGGESEADRRFREQQAELDRAAREREIGSNVTANLSAAGRNAITNLTGDYNRQVAEILNNPQIEAAQKQQLLQQLQTSYRSAAQIIARTYNINFDDLFPGSGSTPTPNVGQPQPTPAPPPVAIAPPPSAPGREPIIPGAGNTNPFITRPFDPLEGVTGGGN